MADVIQIRMEIFIFAKEDEDVALKVLNLWKDNVEAGIWRTAGEDMFFSGPFANEQIQCTLGTVWKQVIFRINQI